jgi:hypothetical protein
MSLSYIFGKGNMESRVMNSTILGNIRKMEGK